MPGSCSPGRGFFVLPTVLKARLPVCTVFLHARWPGPMHAKKRGAHLRESGRSGMVGDPSGLEGAASNSLAHVAESPRALADWDVCLAPISLSHRPALLMNVQPLQKRSLPLLMR